MPDNVYSSQIMARNVFFTPNVPRTDPMLKWVVLALLLSLAFHGSLFLYFNLKKIVLPTKLAPEVLIPINVKRPTIPMLDQPDAPPATPTTSKPIPTLPLDLPQEKPVLTELRVSPQLPELDSPLPLENPPISKMSPDSITKAEKESQRQMEQSLATLSELATKEGPHSSRQPLIKLPPTGKPGAQGLAGTDGIPGLQTVNDLLSKTGSLPTGTRAGIPGGTIYEHGSAELRESAVAQLQKLGELIKRHPNATFIIEGHTDSTGKPQANQVLSEDRANSVKDWLIAHFNIAADRIETVGLGNSKMIVQPQPYDLQSADAFELEIARQQPNRRVEIVIKTNRQ